MEHFDKAEAVASHEITTVSNAQLFAKLCDVERLLLKQQQADKRGLWGVKDIAEYMGFTPAHISRAIVADPRFPDPVDIQGRVDQARRMWLKKEVLAFFERYKAKKPRI